jgi:hypothetical protein
MPSTGHCSGAAEGMSNDWSRRRGRAGAVRLTAGHSRAASTSTTSATASASKSKSKRTASAPHPPASLWRASYAGRGHGRTSLLSPPHRVSLGERRARHEPLRRRRSGLRQPGAPRRSAPLRRLVRVAGHQPARLAPDVAGRHPAAPYAPRRSDRYATLAEALEDLSICEARRGNATSAERQRAAGVATPSCAACCIEEGKRMVPPNPPIRG